MDKLLDKEVHQLYKASPNDCDISNYFGSTSKSQDVITQELDAAGDEGVIDDDNDGGKLPSSSKINSLVF